MAILCNHRARSDPKKIIIIIKEKKKEAGSTSWQPGFVCVCVCFFFSGFLLLL